MNDKLLESFITYCKTYPDERFWQALRNWSGHNFILVANHSDNDSANIKDTFYWTKKDG